jgi:hypothetical protein
MNIEIDKSYIIEARFKKRVSEVEFYEKDDDTILYDTLWRNGEFRVIPATEGECNYIQKFIDLDEDSFDEFDLNTFYDMEMSGTFDGISTDFRGDVTEELEDQIYVGTGELSVHEYLTEELGYEHTDTEYYINGPIDVREERND